MSLTTARNLYGAVVLSVGLIWPAASHATDPIAIADAFFDEIESIGATSAKHGPITYDPGTRTLVIPNISIDWPISFSLGKAGGFSVETTMNAPEVRVIGLREVDGGYRMDEFRYGDGTKMTMKIAAGDVGNTQMVFNGTVYKDVFWPYLPTIQSDPNLPASRYFPYLRWTTQFETGHAEVASITLEQTNPDNNIQKTTYQGLELNDYRGGRIADYRLARIVSETFAATGGGGTGENSQTQPGSQMTSVLRLETGPIIYRGYDIGALIRLIDPESYLLGNTDPNFYSILEEGSASDIRITVQPDTSARIARYAAYGMKVRQPKQSIFAFLDRAIVGGEPSADEIVSFALSVAQSMALERAAIDDIQITTPDENTGKIERIAMRDFSADGLGEFSIDGIAFSAPQEGDIELERFKLSGLVFPTAEAILHMVRIADQGEPPIRAALDVFPMLNKFELSKFAAHIKGGIDVTLERYSSEMSDHIAPIPTKWRERIDDLVLPAIAFQEEPELREFVQALGLNNVRLNSEISIRWDEKTQDLIVGPIAIDIDGAASVVFEARIAGVPRLVFEDPENAQAALATLAFTSMRFELQNEKLVQTALETFAKDQGMTPDQARDVLVAQLRQLVGTLNAPAFAEQVDAAISEFLANPRRLTITAKPDKPLPATQILGQVAIAPGSIIGLLGVDIEASR